MTTPRSKELPRRLTVPKGADVDAITRLVNEWQRDAWESMRSALSGDYAGRLRPTTVRIAGGDARPWDAVLCDASKGAMQVTLPRASEARATVIAVINVSDSDNAITVRCAWSTDRINGATSNTIALAYGARWFYCTGEAWVTVSSSGGLDVEPRDAALLWELDLSQGTDQLGTLVAATDWGGANQWSGSLSVVANANVPGGEVLRASCTTIGATSGGAILWVARDAQIEETSYVVEIDQLSVSASGRFVGVAFLAHDGTGVGGDGAGSGYAYLWGSSATLVRFDQGTVNRTSTTTANNLGEETMSRVRLEVDGEQIPSSLVRFSTAGLGRVSTGANGAGLVRGTVLNQTAWPSEPAAAGWGSIVPHTIGLVMSTGAVASTTFTWDIRAMRVYRHPRDL